MEKISFKNQIVNDRLQNISSSMFPKVREYIIKYAPSEIGD